MFNFNLSKSFNIVIVIVMIIIGIYMACVQGNNLKKLENLNKESQISKWIGYAYIAIAIIGFIISQAMNA